jgi:hypothetical protein
LLLPCGTKQARKTAGQHGESTDRENQPNHHHQWKNEAIHSSLTPLQISVLQSTG